jgi:hypothetical protein
MKALEPTQKKMNLIQIQTKAATSIATTTKIITTTIKIVTVTRITDSTKIITITVIT